MQLSDDDAERALYCVNELLDRKIRAGAHIPGWMRSLASKLDLASALSSAGHQSDSGGEDLGPSPWIGSAEAADILGVHPRTVRRWRADLGGEIIAGRMVFNPRAVHEYAEGRK